MKLSEKYLDDEKQFYDYGTGTVSGSNIFDTSTTGTSFYNDFLDGGDKEYLRKKYNLSGEIVQMTPQEYYDECAKHCFNTSAEKLKVERGEYDRNIINHLKEVILTYKRKFPLTYINYAERQQEGLHRMLTAAELFGWDTKHPVLIVRYADEDRASREIEAAKRKKIESKIRTAIDRALDYKYNSIEELIEQLQWEIDRSFEYDDIEKPVNFDFGEASLQSYSVTVGSVEVDFDKDDIQWKKEKEDDIDDLDFDEDEDFMRRYFGDDWRDEYGDVFDKLKKNK